MEPSVFGPLQLFSCGCAPPYAHTQMRAYYPHTLNNKFYLSSAIDNSNLVCKLMPDILPTLPSGGSQYKAAVAYVIS